jgi:EAL domain-containing protein (putative c-di-GMP-specific phosphodiesterase class I)
MTNDLFIHKKSRKATAWGAVRSPIRASASHLHRSDSDHGNAERVRAETEQRIRRIIDNRSLETHFQSIVNLRTGQAQGVEALSRFAHTPARPPDHWFAEAASVGLGVELEIAAVEVALAEMDHLPVGMYMSINASPTTILSEAFHVCLEDVQAERVVLEVTEHTPITDYPEFAAGIADLRSRGIRLAVDDAGSGYAGFAHLIDLKPDIIKLDIALTRGIDRDPARQALGRALLQFGLDAYRTTMVAEGIETKGELSTLRALGCPVGQGFVLGRPARIIRSPSLLSPSVSPVQGPGLPTQTSLPSFDVQLQPRGEPRSPSPDRLSPAPHDVLRR